MGRKLIVIVLMFLQYTVDMMAQNDKPNVVIIMTDEHNFRTLGCYRNLMSTDQAFVWGDGVIVETPNIDRIANEGSICMNYYSSSPVCTPSRASFVSGLYPVATDCYKNNIPMNNNVVTFAEVLSKQGYVTSYVGKWHLDGDAKPGFAPKRKFGFKDNKYMFNRGHWKKIVENNGKCEVFEAGKSKDADENSFLTDFLTDRTLDIIKRDKNQPFCVMLSLPDPHGPNMVRKPYDNMYKGIEFKHPKTMLEPKANMPKWVSFKKGEVEDYDQEKMRYYFGMVKCVDDNIGKILNYLEEQNLDNNTIVVFTSDHGDLMGEHKLDNKGNPYEGSARIPFLLRYPRKVSKGKVIRKAFTTTDFTPTLLGLINSPQIKVQHGLDASQDFISNKKEIFSDRITYMTGTASNWVAAMDTRYKLVLSVQDKPWLFDLEKDPNELINFYNHKGYQNVAIKLKAELITQLKKYKDRALLKSDLQGL